MNLPAFTSIARPLLDTHCSRCHNGTKGRATATYDLTFLLDDLGQQLSCDWTLTVARQLPAPAAPVADPLLGEAASLFAEVNPADPSTVHDFKFATPAEYVAFRDGVMPWLSTE